MDIIAHVARRTFTRLETEWGTIASESVRIGVKFVLNNFGDDITVHDMARAASLSKFHFLRRFRREAGMTPGAFLQRFRIVRAMEHLVNSDRSIRKIARAVGYKDATAFSRAFLRIAGTQPYLYRHARAQRAEETPLRTN